jgi:hypothetical protein
MKSRLNPVYINNFDGSFNDFSSEVQSNELLNELSSEISTVSSVSTVSSERSKTESERCELMSTNTCEEVKRLCGECCDSSSENKRICCHIESHNYERTPRYNPGVDYFESMVTPVTGLHSRYSKTRGLVEFRMRRKNKTVTLQWESFQGMISGSRIDHLTVTQSIANLPPSPKIWPICIDYGNQIRQGWIEIDPHEINGNIRFYLNTDKSSNHIHMNDWFCIPSSSITWIVD